MKTEREKLILDKSFCYKWSDYPAKAAIVFIHGLGGDSQATWGAFPQLTMGSSIGQNFDIISYGYTSNILLPKSPEIGALIAEFTSFCQSELRQYETVILISHSLGSLLVCGMLLSYENKSLNNNKYLSHIMITPAFFGGAKWASLSGSKTARQLKVGSEFLTAIQDRWRNSHVKESITSYVAYGTKDRIVPLPKDDLSPFAFQEHRIQSDHIKSPKIIDINNSLFRGIIFAIELSLRFNSRDSRKYYINMILRTDKSDWHYDSKNEEFILLSDFRFRIKELSSEKMDCNFNEGFPDKTAYECLYSFKFSNIGIYEFYLWNLDGGRYLVPAPLLIESEEPGEFVRVVEQYNYRLAQLLEAGGMYEDLDGALKRAKIRIDHKKNVII